MTLREYLDSKLGLGRDTSTDTIYTCPFCNRPKMYIVTDSLSDKAGMYHCFHCDRSGGLVSLIAYLDNTNRSSAVATAGALLGGVSLVYSNTDSSLGLTPEERILAVLSMNAPLRHSHSHTKDDIAELTVPKLAPPELPIGLRYLSQDLDKEEAKPFVRYLLKRGFTIADILRYNIGYIVAGGTYSAKGNLVTIQNHVVFFCYDKQGNYQYWNTRAIDKQTPKSINAPELKEHYGKGKVVYNLYEAVKKRDIVLTEGVPDALTLGQSGIATYGKGVTDVQLKLILDNVHKDQNIYVMLDMDAYPKLLEVAEKIAKYHKNTYMVYNPTRQDANSLGRNKAWQVIHKYSIPVTEAGVMRFLMVSE